MRFDENGIHIHQSDLKNHCLEKLRLDTVATGPRVENDAATVGTVLHTVIERELKDKAPYSSLEECQKNAAWEYVNMLETYQAEGRPFVLSSFNTHAAAVDQAVGLASQWYHCEERQTLLSGGGDLFVEWNFDLPFTEIRVKKNGKKAEDIPVFLAGTADIIFNNQVWDWKSAGSPYRRWEYQRWGRQPDVYTWAAAQSGLITPVDGKYEFLFKVFVRNNAPTDGCQTVQVYRSSNSWDWLADLIDSFVNMSYNMGLDRQWPLNDQHVLCSPKWCSFFDICKGVRVSGVEWI